MLSKPALLLVAIAHHAAHHAGGWEAAVVVGSVLLASVIAVAWVSTHAGSARQTGDHAWAEFERQFRAYVDRMDRREGSIDERE
jgi:hypothetical protein